MQCNVSELENLQIVLTLDSYNEFIFCHDLSAKFEEERLTEAIALAWKEFRIEDVQGLKEQRAALNYTPIEGSTADMSTRVAALGVHFTSQKFYCCYYGCFHYCYNLVCLTSQ